MREADRAILLRSLGRLVRGLSTLFWTLPLAFIVQVETARTDWFGSLGPWGWAPAAILNAALLYGLAQLRPFQKQERIWQGALTRAEVLGLVNTGLAPFLFWWHRFPGLLFFTMTSGLLVLTNLLFLMQLNRTAQRLAAMIPDETVRSETSLFAAFNLWLLGFVFVAVSAWFAARAWHGLEVTAPRYLTALRLRTAGALLFLTIVPLALTMALFWKIKEVVFAGIFSHAD